MALQKAKTLERDLGPTWDAQRQRRVKRNVARRIELEDEWAAVLQQISDDFLEHLDIEGAYVTAMAGWTPVTARARVMHAIWKAGVPSAKEVKLKEHTVEDVISGKYKVGVEGNAGADIERAKSAGLYTTEVNGVHIYAKDEKSAKPLVDYLKRGGKYGSRQFSRLLGYTTAEIDEYERMLRANRAVPTAAGPIAAPVEAEVATGLISAQYSLDIAQGVQAYLEMALRTSQYAGQAALDHMGMNKTFSWAHPRAMAQDLFGVRGSKVINNLYGAHLEKLSAIITEATDPRYPKTLDQVKASIKKEWPKLSAYQVARIARSETASVWTSTTANAFHANGITRVESIIAHGPSITIETGLPCDMCVDAAAAGPMSVLGDLPPWHPHCRCEIVPHMLNDDGTEWFPPDEPWTGGERPVCGLEDAVTLSRRRARGLRQMRAVLKASGVPGCLTPAPDPGVQYGGETFYNRPAASAAEKADMKAQINAWPEFQGDFPQAAVKAAARAIVDMDRAMKVSVGADGNLTAVSAFADDFHFAGHPQTILVYAIATKGSGARRIMGQYARDAWGQGKSLAVKLDGVSPQMRKSLEHWGFKPTTADDQIWILDANSLKLPFKIADDAPTPFKTTPDVPPTTAPTTTAGLPTHSEVPVVVAADETLESLEAKLYTLNNKIAGNRKKIKKLESEAFPDHQKIKDTNALLDEQIAERVLVKQQIDQMKKGGAATPEPKPPKIDDPPPQVATPAVLPDDPPPLPPVTSTVPIKAATYETTIAKQPAEDLLDATQYDTLLDEVSGWSVENDATKLLDQFAKGTYMPLHPAQKGLLVMRDADGELRGLIPYLKNDATKRIELATTVSLKYPEDIEGMLRASTSLAKIADELNYDLGIKTSAALLDQTTFSDQLIERGMVFLHDTMDLGMPYKKLSSAFGLKSEIHPAVAPGVPIALPLKLKQHVQLAQDALAEVLTKTDGFHIGMLPESDDATARLLANNDIAIHMTDTPSPYLQNSIVHEYGHYIDKNLLSPHGPGFWESAPNNSGVLDDFFAAAEKSPTIQGIKTGEFKLLQGDPKTTDYMLDRKEIWARAFDQYISTKSGNMDMLHRFKQTQNDPLMRFEYWQDAEFAPIAAEIDKVLSKANLLLKPVPTGTPLVQVHYTNTVSGLPVTTAPMNEADAMDLMAQLSDSGVKATVTPEGAAAPIIDDVSVGDGPPIPTEFIQKIHEKGLTKWPPDKGLKAQEIFGDEFKDTEELWKIKGQWLETRVQLHNDIIAAHFADRVPPPVGEKSAFLTAGGGASGKSSMKFNYKGSEVDLDFLEKQGDVIFIDADRIKKMIPEYKKMTEAGDAYAANGVHEESSAIARMIAKRARAEGYSIVIDSTGSSGRFLQNVQDFIDEGYKTQVSMVSIPTNTAIVRSIQRAEKVGGASEGRFISVTTLKAAHRQASLQLIKWQHMKGLQWRVYDNSGAEIKLVAEKKFPHGTPDIYDETTFKAIKNKANEEGAALRPAPQKKQPEGAMTHEGQGQGAPMGATVESLKGQVYTLSNKIAGWKKKLKANPDDAKAKQMVDELTAEREQVKEQLKAMGEKPTAAKPEPGTTTRAPKPKQDKPDPEPEPELVHQPDERRVVPGGTTKEKGTTALNKKMQEGYSGYGAVNLKKQVMDQMTARVQADPRWNARMKVKPLYDNSQSAEWNALNRREEELTGWEQIREAFGYGRSAYGVQDDRAIMAQLINNWARTSSNRDWRGVIIQIAVKREFGTNVRVFAADHWNDAEKSDAIVRQAEEMMEQFPGMEGALRAFVRGQYEETQDLLKALEVDEVTLYRGLRIPQSAVDASPAEGGVPWGPGLSTITISDNPIASWSIRHSVSRGVFYGGTMLRASAPREMVFSCPLTGFGCASEYEVLILNAGDNSAWVAQNGDIVIDAERRALLVAEQERLTAQMNALDDEAARISAMNNGAGPDYGTFERTRSYEVRQEKMQLNNQFRTIQNMLDTGTERWRYEKETDLKNYITEALQENPSLAGKTVKVPRAKVVPNSLAGKKVAGLKAKISSTKRKITGRKKKMQNEQDILDAIERRERETGVTSGYLRPGESYGGVEYKGKQIYYSAYTKHTIESNKNHYAAQISKLESEQAKLEEQLAAAEQELADEKALKKSRRRSYTSRLNLLKERALV